MRLLDLAYVIALGAGLGLASAYYAVAGRPAFGLVQIGPWSAWPRSGGRDIDPYWRAYLARGVHLPLGSGEGLELIAERDEAGAALDSGCRYRVSGSMPTTRGWTLGVVAKGDGQRSQASLTDAQALRDEAGGLNIVVATGVQPGDWLPLEGAGRFALRLTLYDTPISSQASELRPGALPRIERLDCR